MPGKIKAMIDTIIAKRSQGNPNLVAPLKIKLIMKGIDPDQWSDASPDDPVVIARLQSAARDMGVVL